MQEATDQQDAILRAAIIAQDLPAIAALVERHPEALERRCERGWTPLIVAAYHGATLSAGQLFALGAHPDTTNPKGTTPLMYAKGHYLRSGDPAMMRLLLAQGAAPEARDDFGLRLIDYVPEPDRPRVAAILAGQ